MRKCFVVLFLFITIGFCSSDEFQFPEVRPEVQSIQNAFYKLLDNIAEVGYIEYDPYWASSDETTIAKYKAHLDGVFENMSYEKVQQYVSSVRHRIDNLETQRLSKSQIQRFNDFLGAARHYNLFTSSFKQDDFLLQEAWIALNTFSTWEVFFANGNTVLTDFLTLHNVKTELTRMIDQELPQYLIPDYMERLTVFCSEWGIEQ